MELSHLLITLGVLFIAGLAADEVGRLTRLPRVTLLLLVGLAAGNAGFRLIPTDAVEWFEGVSVVALTMVAFVLGGALSRQNLVSHGRMILSISLVIALGTIIVVAAGLTAIGTDPRLALILGAIASATAPAAMADVIRQSGVSNGFTDTLKGIVAIDDVWGVIAFSVILVLASQSDGGAGVLIGTARELGGGAALGIAIGLPAAFLTGRLSPGEPLQTEAFGIVFLTAGLAMWLEVSFLFSGMVAGTVIVNFARHHNRAFHEIEHIQRPFMIIFFLLAGATLEFDVLLTIGWTGAMYVVLRILSRLVCGWVGSRLGGASVTERNWYGPALLPQAGVAVGMALVAGESFPEWAKVIMALTISSTVIFEIIGPPITLAAIRRVSGAD